MNTKHAQVVKFFERHNRSFAVTYRSHPVTAYYDDLESKFVGMSLNSSYYKELTQARILDAGCGNGRYFVPLTRLGHDIVGIDIEPESIKSLAQHSKKVMIADIARLPLKDGSFSIVMSLFNTVNYVLPPDEAIREFYRVLEPGGILLLSLRSGRTLRFYYEILIGTIGRTLRVLKLYNFVKRHFWKDGGKLNSDTTLPRYPPVHKPRYTCGDLRKMLANSNFTKIRTRGLVNLGAFVVDLPEKYSSVARFILFFCRPLDEYVFSKLPIVKNLGWYIYAEGIKEGTQKNEIYSRNKKSKENLT